MPNLDYSLLLPDQDREAFLRQIRVTSTEVARLHGLPDRWLGEAVLRLARRMRERFPTDADRGTRTADGYLTWQAVPEMARRLGCAVTRNEATDPDVRRASDWELRMAVAQAHRTARTFNEHPGVEALSEADADLLDLWTNDVANGSPVALLLDRVAPPAPDAPDAFATYVREVRRSRNLPDAGAWSPIAEPGLTDPEPDATPAPGW